MGMSPAEALHAATATGAAALDRDDVGVLAVGRRGRPRAARGPVVRPSRLPPRRTPGGRGLAGRARRSRRASWADGTRGERGQAFGDVAYARSRSRATARGARPPTPGRNWRHADPRVATGRRATGRRRFQMSYAASRAADVGPAGCDGRRPGYRAVDLARGARRATSGRAQRGERHRGGQPHRVAGRGEPGVAQRLVEAQPATRPVWTSSITSTVAASSTSAMRGDHPGRPLTRAAPLRSR